MKNVKSFICIVSICAAVSLAAVETAYWAAMHREAGTTKSTSPSIPKIFSEYRKLS